MFAVLSNFFLATKLGRCIAVGLGLVLLLAWFYSWAAGNARARCELRVVRESERIRLEVRKELDELVKDTTKRAVEAETQNVELERKIDEIIEEARKSVPDSTVCVPGSVTKRLRELR